MGSHVLLLLLVGSLTLAAARAQMPATAPPPSDVPGGVMELPLDRYDFKKPTFRVADVDPAGTVRLELDPNVPDEVRGIISPPEGFYLLLTGPSPRGMVKRVYRAQVTDVGTKAQLTLSVGPAAAALVARDSGALLLRPRGATTSLMRGLPDVIEVDLGAEPGSPEAIMEARRLRSSQDLRLIGLALHNFLDVNGVFPPAVLHGPDGKPWHSWRVLILPYLEEMELFEEYDFTRPWNAPENLRLLDRMPKVYRDPASDGKNHFTHYAALIGPGAVFSPEGGRIADLKQIDLFDGGQFFKGPADGDSTRIAVAPVSPERKIPWTKPEDIRITPDFPGLGKPGGIGAPYRRNGDLVAPVLFQDGHVLSITSRISPQDLRSLLSSPESKPISRNAIPTDTPAAPINLFERTLRIRISGGEATAKVE